MHEDDLVYFNNSRGFRHGDAYLEDFGIERAFFDMKTTGRQAKQVPELSEGQECVVASAWANDGKIDFDWYFLDNEIIVPIQQRKLRVFIGDHVLTETLPKVGAADHKIYGHFFNIDKNFKRLAAFVKEVALTERPTRNIKRSQLAAEEVDGSKGPYIEGATRQITVNAYERNAKARAECIEHYGCRCSICGFSFQKAYGDIAADYIHVHHLRPLSKLKQAYEVDPIKDLRPVCANCHAVIHLGGDNRTIETVEQMLNGKPSRWFI